MNKVPRFMREYANYIEREHFSNFNADIENLLLSYERGHIAIAEVMRTLAEIERSEQR